VGFPDFAGAELKTTSACFTSFKTISLGAAGSGPLVARRLAEALLDDCAAFVVGSVGSVLPADSVFEIGDGALCFSDVVRAHTRADERATRPLG